MVDGIGFKEEMKNERAKWNNMTWGQRYQYFKDYYLKLTLVVIALIIAGISLTRTIIRNNREIVLGGEFVNVYANDALYSKVNEEYFDYIGGDEKKQMIDLVTEKTIDLSEEGYGQQGYYAEMQVIAMLSSSELDYMFLNDTVLERWASQDAYADLRDVLTDEQYAEYEPYIVTVKNEETGESYPAAIRLTGTDFAEKYGIVPVYGEEAYLVIISNSQNIDKMGDFIDYLFQ